MTVCSWCFFVVANDCPKLLHGVRQGGLGSTSSRACGLARNFPALGLDDLTLQPTELCDHRKMLLCCYFMSVAFFFCRPSGCLVHRKIQPYRPKWRSPEGAMVRPTKQVRGRRDDTGGWLNSLSVQAPTPRGARYRATFPQHTGDGTRIPRHLAHQLKKPLCVCRTTRASVANGVLRL